MRSRYCAYALCIPAYLIQTTYPAKRKGLNEAEIIEWSRENKWLQLEIVTATTSVVEFKAHFQDATGMVHVHHERSTFTLDKGRWYYVKGQFY
jgi:SEC-C motif-containing protein